MSNFCSITIACKGQEVVISKELRGYARVFRAIGVFPSSNNGLSLWVLGRYFGQERRFWEVTGDGRVPQVNNLMYGSNGRAFRVVC